MAKVKLTNNMVLDSSCCAVKPDYKNVLFSGTISTTAITNTYGDGWIIAYSTSGHGTFLIDGVRVSDAGSADDSMVRGCAWFIAKGSTIASTTGTITSKIFGVK